MTYTATVTSKRQITLPAKLFSDFDISPGDKLLISRQGEVLIMQRQLDLVDRLAGSVQPPSRYKALSFERMLKQAKQDFLINKSKRSI
jgi:AbrB family looped-hinge helix DNA binding protein